MKTENREGQRKIFLMNNRLEQRGSASGQAERLERLRGQPNPQ
jgi:hypothetical protein